MSPRSIAIVMLVLVLGFIGTMASVQLFVRDPLPIIGANQMLHLRTQEVDPPVAMQIAIDGSYRVDVQVQPPGHETPPQISLRPSENAPITLDLHSAEETLLVANGQLTRPGRWELDIRTPGGRETLRFVVRE